MSLRLREVRAPIGKQSSVFCSRCGADRQTRFGYACFLPAVALGVVTQIQRGCTVWAVAELLLFHHVQGLTTGVIAFSEALRSAGHVVHTPDLFDGAVFGSIDAGAAYAEAVGFGEIIERGVSAADDYPDATVFVGISLGVLPAQKLAQTRPNAAGAVLLEACAPISEFGDGWPVGLSVQIHGMDADQFFAGEGDIEAARSLVERASESPRAELFTYSGDTHLFTDTSLLSYDRAATSLVVERMIDFLNGVS